MPRIYCPNGKNKPQPGDVATHGPAGARFILDEIAALARSPHVAWSPELVTPYVNSVRAAKYPLPLRT